MTENAQFDWTDYARRVARHESNGQNINSKSNSSASGFFQFTDPTWRQVTGRRDRAINATPEEQGRALRTFSEGNARILRANGIPVTNENLYAAHFLGAGVAVPLLKATNPHASAQTVLPASYYNANPFLQGKTIEGVRQFTRQAMGQNQQGQQTQLAFASAPNPANYQAPNLQQVPLSVLEFIKNPTPYQQLDLPDAPVQAHVGAPPKLEQRDIQGEIQQLALLAPQLPGGQELFQQGLAAAAAAIADRDPSNAGGIIAALGAAFSQKRTELETEANGQLRQFAGNVLQHRFAGEAENRASRNADATNAYNVDNQNAQIDFGNLSRQDARVLQELQGNNELFNRSIDRQDATNNLRATTGINIVQGNVGIQNQEATLATQLAQAFNEAQSGTERFNVGAQNQDRQQQQTLAVSGAQQAQQQANFITAQNVDIDRINAGIAQANIGIPPEHQVALLPRITAPAVAGQAPTSQTPTSQTPPSPVALSRRALQMYNFAAPRDTAGIETLAPDSRQVLSQVVSQIAEGQTPHADLVASVVSSPTAIARLPVSVRRNIQGKSAQEQADYLANYMLAGNTINPALDVAAREGDPIARAWRYSRHGVATAPLMNIILPDSRGAIGDSRVRQITNNVLTGVENSLNPVMPLRRALADAFKYDKGE